MFLSKSISENQSRFDTKQRQKKLIFTLIFISFLSCLGWEFTTACSIMLLSLVAAFELWNIVGKDIGISELAGFLAVLQWIICPYVAYHFPLYQDGQYAMSGTVEWYFSYAVPGTALFLAGMCTAKFRRPNGIPDFLYVQPSQYYFVYGLALLSVLSNLIVPYVPGSVSFVMKIFSDLKFGAIILFLFSAHPLRYVLIAILFMVMFFGPRNSGMFHEPILWSLLFVLYAFYRFRNSCRPFAMTLAKVIVVICGCISILSLQMVKSDFRDSLFRGDDVSITRLALAKTLDVRSFLEPESLVLLLTRFNQGWIVSRVMTNIPSYQPHAFGRSFVSAAETVLMPRILFPSRPPIEIAKRFQEFTGIRLNDKTCMGVSLLGEAYGNFGRFGGILTMGVLGFLFSIALQYARSLIPRWPLIFFFLGPVFSEAIKAETDSTMVFNYIAKAFIVVVLVVYLFGRSFGCSSPSKSSVFSQN